MLGSAAFAAIASQPNRPPPGAGSSRASCDAAGWLARVPPRRRRGAPRKHAAPKPQQPRADDQGAPEDRRRDLLGQTLNNRFKIESKIGEGGFGAVYRGVQLATGRKVALKLLHPEMTKDENLVARFRREGMVLCNLRDAHTITTYDFDQTPDGTLYIAMELLEGKSLHQVFHEQAPLEWKRDVQDPRPRCAARSPRRTRRASFTAISSPRTSTSRAGPGNPEFVKILDFGIAKVMRGDSIDPQSPQLTATGQTLGTLEYMSPEQLMGKAARRPQRCLRARRRRVRDDHRAAAVPRREGPGGPHHRAAQADAAAAVGQANPKANLPPAADRVILKCLEKDKNNRYRRRHRDGGRAAGSDRRTRATATQSARASRCAASSQRAAPRARRHARDAARRRCRRWCRRRCRCRRAAARRCAMRRRRARRAADAYAAVAIPYPQAQPQHAIDAGSRRVELPAGRRSTAMYAGSRTQTDVNAKTARRSWIWWVVGLLVLGAGGGRGASRS